VGQNVGRDVNSADRAITISTPAADDTHPIMMRVRFGRRVKRLMRSLNHIPVSKQYGCDAYRLAVRVE
jgi:hypothetical protein